MPAIAPLSSAGPHVNFPSPSILLKVIVTNGAVSTSSRPDSGPGVTGKAPADLWFCSKNSLFARNRSERATGACGFPKGGACLALNQGECP